MESEPEQSWTWEPLILPRERNWACGCSPDCTQMSAVALASHNPDWRYGLCKASARLSGCPDALLGEVSP